MYKKNNRKSMILIIVLFIFISLGYAILNANIKINGTSKINNSSWNVHFENLRISDGSVVVDTNDQTLQSAHILNDTTKVEYSVLLDKPGDYYEFMVDAVNSGSIDAMVDVISSVIKIDDEEVNSLPNYLNYSISYEDGRDIEQKHALDASSSETYKVRIEYNKDILENDLPNVDKIIEIIFNPTYIQCDETKLTVPRTTFLTGSDINIKMKQLAGDNTSSNGVRTQDNRITAIRKANSEPASTNMTANNIVSTPDSTAPIYMWYDSGTIYWWSRDHKPNLNSDSQHMFRDLRSLTDISGLEYFDTSNVVYLTSSFAYDGNLSNISAISNWDVSNVVNMQTAFTGIAITNTNAFSKWNTKNLENLAATFQNDTSLTSLEGLKNWNTSKLKSLFLTFASSTDNNNTLPMLITDLRALKKWDVSKVEDMRATFQSCNSLLTLNGLENWNTSSVLLFKSFAGGDNSFEMHLQDISALRNWNVSNATNFSTMFQRNVDLSDASALNNWNINRNADFTKMFYYVPVHPEFSRISGTWNSDGTFIPS